MAHITVELDSATLEQAQQLATARGITLDMLLVHLIRHLARAGSSPDPLLGQFADDIEAVDVMVDHVMRNREAQSLADILAHNPEVLRQVSALVAHARATASVGHEHG